MGTFQFAVKLSSAACVCTGAYGASCGCVCVNGTEPCNIGQTCFWFSQGCAATPSGRCSSHVPRSPHALVGCMFCRCTIGCPTCTGVKARAQVDICGKGMKARICDHRLRTYNVMAPCNSDKDTYKHNPWRAPGTAPGERDSMLHSSYHVLLDSFLMSERAGEPNPSDLCQYSTLVARPAVDIQVLLDLAPPISSIRPMPSTVTSAAKS